jgi:hypothetical protein
MKGNSISSTMIGSTPPAPSCSRCVPSFLPKLYGIAQFGEAKWPKYLMLKIFLKKEKNKKSTM